MAKAQMLAGESRPLLEVLDEAAAVLRQDAGEYAYIALFGAVPAALAVLLPGLVGGPIGMSLIAPLVVLAAVFTYATSTAALCVGANHLQPDAGTAAATVLRRSIGVVMPWLPLMIALWAASFAGAAFAHYLGPVPHVTIAIALVGASLWYAFPRVLSAPALFDTSFGQELSWKQADAVSAAIVKASPRRIALLWLVVLLPAILTSLVGLATGLDTVTGALAVFFGVAVLPIASAIMTLWFFDAASRMDIAPVIDPRRGSPQRV